jgi:hypothetical protein
VALYCCCHIAACLTARLVSFPSLFGVAVDGSGGAPTAELVVGLSAGLFVWLLGVQLGLVALLRLGLGVASAGAVFSLTGAGGIALTGVAAMLRLGLVALPQLGRVALLGMGLGAAELRQGVGCCFCFHRGCCFCFDWGWQLQLARSVFLDGGSWPSP